MAYNTITVMGLGFVGLTTALGFATKGNQVYGYDIDEERVAQLRNQMVPFAEPGLDRALKETLGNTFHLASDLQGAVLQSDYIFLCVGTPCMETGEADLGYLNGAIDSIAKGLGTRKQVLIVKSTVPPSTTRDKVVPYVENLGVNWELTKIANNPEFLREGYCWNDFMNPDRIVCGVGDQQSEELLRNLYGDFNCPFYGVSYNTAEFIKYLSNSMLATMISYANEMSIIADQIGGIDVKNSFEILHEDKRWNGCNMKSYVYPGCGYGGYCLPKDTVALHANAVSHGYEPELLGNVIRINEEMPRYFVHKIQREFGNATDIGILGLSFKPESDDVRMSPAAAIISLLLKETSYTIHAYDPIAMKQFRRVYEYPIVYHENKEEVCACCDHIVVVTMWKEFLTLRQDYEKKHIIDCRYKIEQREASTYGKSDDMHDYS